MKNILVVSGCPMRGDTTGLIGHFLNALEDIDKDAFSISLFDIGFFDKKHNPNDYPVNKYYGLPVYKIETIIRKIPRLRSWYAERLIINTFRRLIKNNNFDWVIFYHIPVFADIMIKIAHSKRVKVVFYPWGSEILRVDNKTHNRLLKSFSEVDFVVGIEKSNTIIAAQKQYNVPSDRIKCIRPYHYGVRMLMNVKDKLPKEEMANQIGLHSSNYNIVCGYNGYRAHKHLTIVKAFTLIKEFLPANYCLIFPMTYGADPDYLDEIRQRCADANLNAVFLTTFLSDEQMAYLHLVTDLFIEIQPTDSGNAFMIESLFAKNQIITGAWLKYEQFEQFGAPYHLINSLDELPEILRNIFSNKIPQAVIPQKLIDLFTIPDNYSSSSFWTDLFNVNETK